PPTPAGWHALLQAACESVPGTEAGSLYVVEHGDFVLLAQCGFDDRLLGERSPPSGQRAWYSGPDDQWTAGTPRVLRGYAVTAAANAALRATFQAGGEQPQGQWRLGDITETLGVPITADGHVIAFLNLDRFGPGVVFDAAAQETAMNFAVQAALLLAPRARRERGAQRTRELEALVQITGSLRDARSADDVIHAISSMSHVVLNARQAIYLSYDPASDTLNSNRSYGLPSQTPVHSQRRGQGLSWAAIAARDVIRVNNMDADQRILRVDGVGGGACLIAPLQTPDRLLGVLVVIRSHPFGENDAQLARTLAAQGVTALERTERIRAMEEGREGILAALGRALEARDFETQGHTTRVLDLALQVGRRMNLAPEELRALRDGAYLHDLGKVQIPDAVLLKPGPLTADEWVIMRQHSPAGEELARHIPGLSLHALQVIRHHHEHWDGTGYPDGLSGPAIPLLARIFSVCDVFDALTSTRPYKCPWTVQDALDEIRRQSGVSFDPQVVQVFLTVMAEQRAQPSRGGPASLHPRLPPRQPGE
ncbi:HD-GYP domain-containing protein, partial [Deinococcus aquaticus]|uniref:HD-GYP domain-containing protein n=1 Tax=Deinococcus aquaticus TaxID=328692 RepID=UPI003F4491A9